MSRAQATRRASDPHANWMRVLLDLPFVGVGICEARDRRWTRLNDRLCALLGYGRDELLRRNWRDVCHTGDHARADAAFKRLQLRRAPLVRAQIRLLHKDGRVIPVEVDLSFVRTRSGKSASHVVALVTEAPRVQPAAEELTAQTIFHDGRTPMVLLDAASGNVVGANPAAERFYGWTQEEMQRLGLHVWDVSLTERAVVAQRLREAASGAIGRLEGRHRTAGGELRDVEVYCGPANLRGRPCVYGIVHDRTEIKRSETARHEAEEKLAAIVEQSITGIYIIQDGCFSYVNRRMAEIFGYEPDALIGLPALEVVAPADRDRVAENIRRRHAGEVASMQYDFLGLRRDGNVIDVGAHGSTANLQGRRVIVGVLQDITERRRAQRAMEEHLARMQAAMHGAVGALSRMVDLRDPYTAGHERRVASLSGELGRQLGMSEDDVRALDIAARVHDIGKISVPSEILAKPSRLSASEFEIVKLHAANGFDILGSVDFPWPVAEMVAQHHERLDGSGYPKGLKNGQILPNARILAVADVIEAMSSHRPYRASLGIEPALAEIERGAGLRYDADVSTCALRLFRDKAYRIPD